MLKHFDGVKVVRGKNVYEGEGVGNYNDFTNTITINQTGLDVLTDSRRSYSNARETFKSILVHELAHAWDDNVNWRTSDDLSQYMKKNAHDDILARSYGRNEDGTINSGEAFATSIEGLIYGRSVTNKNFYHCDRFAIAKELLINRGIPNR